MANSSARSGSRDTRGRPPIARRFDRHTMLDELGSETFDVLVIGGGITGVGVALDAVTRGLRTALVEREDFASGTSSRSSKLVHGGLRYLQNGDIRLVYEALHERHRLLRNAPHLVDVLPFMLPILTRDGVIPRKVARGLGSALWMYDLTGGWRIGKRHRRLRADEAHAHVPTLPDDRLASAYLYFDAAADDARLTLAVARTAADHGAILANRCRVVELIRTTPEPGGPASRVNGAIVEADGRRIEVRASVVVNATGVWADEIRSLDEIGSPPSIRPAKGIHLTIPWDRIRNDLAVIIPVPKDKRSLFVVPWIPRPQGGFQFAYVGTTDTEYDGPLDDPHCTAADIRYVMDALTHSFETPIGPEDVTASWAGLRPLIDDPSASRTADLSRVHQVLVSESGVIRVVGGKLTTYRRMASDTVDAVVRELTGSRRSRSRTARLRLRGGAGYRPVRSVDAQAHLAGRYGTDAAEISALIAYDHALAEPLVHGLPYLRAEAVYAVRSEMATTLTDVLLRRTRAHLLDRAAALEAADDVARLIGGELGWDASETERQLAEYRGLCEREQLAATGATTVEPAS